MTFRPEFIGSEEVLSLLLPLNYNFYWKRYNPRLISKQELVK